MCLNNLVFRVRAPVGVFYLNMSKKGKKQDVNDDSIVLPYHHWKILLERNISPFLFATRRRPKAFTRDVWVYERITGMLDGNEKLSSVSNK